MKQILCRGPAIIRHHNSKFIYLGFVHGQCNVWKYLSVCDLYIVSFIYKAQILKICIRVVFVYVFLLFKTI
jgi:hypothetical protein